jgi:site-specific recombinase XerD
MPNINLQNALDEWLSVLKENKSKNTFLTGLAASREFVRAVGNMPIENLDEEQYSVFLSWLKKHSTSTEKLYATMVYLFFEYLAHKNIKPINIATIRYLRRNETRKIGKRLREIDKNDLSEFKNFVFDLDVPEDDLQLARAKAWITLAFESGLRAFEFCGLRGSNVNLAKHYGVVLGKGDKEAKFYFTSRSSSAINYYLKMRERIESKRGANIPKENRPIFVSHSKRGFRHLSPIDTETARADLKRVVSLYGGKQKINTHFLRHFLVDAILTETNNTETARKAARHDSIATTQRYLHVDDNEVQEAHKKVFGDKNRHTKGKEDGKH